MKKRRDVLESVQRIALFPAMIACHKGSTRTRPMSARHFSISRQVSLATYFTSFFLDNTTSQDMHSVSGRTVYNFLQAYDTKESRKAPGLEDKSIID